MKNCPHCGRINNDDACFCDGCGAQLEVQTEPTANTFSVPAGEVKPALIENRTMFSKQMMSKFYKPTLYVGVLFCVLSVISIVFCIAPTFLQTMWVIFAVTAGINVFGGAMFLLTYIQNSKNPMFAEGKSQMYAFCDDGISARYFDGEKEISSGTMLYSMVSKVVAGKDFISIYCQQNRIMYIVDAHGFLKGSASELFALLKERCDAKATKYLK